MIPNTAYLDELDVDECPTIGYLPVLKDGIDNPYEIFDEESDGSDGLNVSSSVSRWRFRQAHESQRKLLVTKQDTKSAMEHILKGVEGLLRVSSADTKQVSIYSAVNASVAVFVSANTDKVDAMFGGIKDKLFKEKRVRSSRDSSSSEPNDHGDGDGGSPSGDPDDNGNGKGKDAEK